MPAGIVTHLPCQLINGFADIIMLYIISFTNNLSQAMHLPNQGKCHRSKVEDQILNQQLSMLWYMIPTVSPAERCDLVGVKLEKRFQIFRICAKGVAKLYGSIWLILLEKAV